MTSRHSPREQGQVGVDNPMKMVASSGFGAHTSTMDNHYTQHMDVPNSKPTSETNSETSSEPSSETNSEPNSKPNSETNSKPSDL